MTHKVIIKRSEWQRGEGSDEAYLFTDYNGRPQRCCLGFYGNQVANLSDEQLDGSAVPSEMKHHYPWPSLLINRSVRQEDKDKLETISHYASISDEVCITSCDVEGVLMQINDSTDLDDDARESLIIYFFAEYLDTEVEFIP